MKKRLMIYSSIVVLIAMISFYEILWAPNNFDGDRFIFISKGDGFEQVVDSLERAGIVRSRFLFVLAEKIVNLQSRIQIGKYRFQSGMSNKDIVEDLRSGSTIELITVTIPEGYKTSRVAKLLAKSLGIDSLRFMEFANDTHFVRTLISTATSLEGYLMPNTYKFYWQTDEEQIIKRLVGEFWKYFSDSLLAVIRNRGVTISEILTIASIVESETAIDSERAIIAGVYYNRLRKGMQIGRAHV